ncbi:MAG: heavy-metal-associated domain-containing protein [Phyllobacteriaceae bacterium]|nr:heavy-metal-associated domain-containing protein [Phyllobacteriaceae bacterium]
MDVTLRIEGMSCGGCAASVEKALRAAGASEIRVDLEKGKAYAHADGSVAADDLRQAVDDAGYEAVVEA